MEAAEKTLSYRDDTGLYRKLVHGNKDKCSAETRNDESNYVDLDELLDWKSNGRKVIETCNGNQRTVLDPNHNLSDEQSPGLRELSDNIDQMLEHSKDNGPDALVIEDSPMDLLLTLPDSNVDLGNSTELQTKVGQLYCDVPSEFEELQYTDMYLNSKTESDDSESIVLRDHRVPNIIEDESHYITTHEIQLTELDHDLDYDSGRDIEDDNLVYSFVDYASFESNETTEGTLTLEGRNQAQYDAPRSCSMDDLTAARPAKAGNEVSLQHIDLGEITEATQKKASFASSLLTNVISKKMQLEQECKKEKEGIRHSRPQHSACRYHKDTDIIKGIGRGVYMQYSDMGLGYNIHCAGEKRAVDSRPVSCDLKEVCADASINEADVTKDGCEATMGLLSHSENSAFKSWNDSEPGPHQEHDVRNSINTDITSSCSGVIDVPQTTGVVKSVSSSSMAAPLAFDRGRYKSCATKESLPQLIKSGNPDSENYLTMPAENELQNSNLKVTGSSREVSQTSITDPKRPDQHCMQCLKETPKVMEKKSLDTASIYHSFRPYAVQGAKQPQVLCLSPNANPVPATPSGGDTFQLTQRKMLLDPPTGHYYLVDTPVQPATRRLIDLESGQYVDIPQGLPVNTVPVSPTTLNAGGAYKPTYMIYPGFLSPTLGAQVVMAPQVAPQVAPHSEAENVAMETAPGKCILGPVVGQAGNIAESPYYSATRGSEPVSAPSYHFTSRGGVAVSEEKPPVVSITSQQRPRIITPHSYDVTTMSLVVDHR
ncbi:hypothetical protein DPEC_G00192020 [Dallia pectoralis]|uniref:Uncharacterized protein n=1 Tax=Dallia pectoralis TaxID=75939 RepID=A0ACC2GCF5_DALPE|nr:hypothetical protein DPEC_G00192020 [Dallia pectoralis]